MDTQEIIRNNKKAAYKLNHSDLRGMARHDKDRSKKLKEICQSRQFWKGDKYSKPANIGALAALLTIENQSIDILAFRSKVNEHLKEPSIRAAMSGCVRLSIRAYPTNLPA